MTRGEEHDSPASSGGESSGAAPDPGRGGVGGEPADSQWRAAVTGALIGAFTASEDTQTSTEPAPDPPPGDSVSEPEPEPEPYGAPPDEPEPESAASVDAQWRVVHDLASDIRTLRSEVAAYEASSHTNHDHLSHGLSALRSDITAVFKKVDGLSALRADITAVSTKVDELSAMRADIAAKVYELSAVRADIAAKVDELSAVRADIVAKVDELSAVRAEISDVAAQVDELIRDGLDTRFAETGARLVGDLDARLASRIQRFEALSQAMMTLVGEPVDALAEKLNQLAKVQQSTPDLERTIGEIRQTQAQLEAAISALRQDGLEREAPPRQKRSTRSNS